MTISVSKPDGSDLEIYYKDEINGLGRFLMNDWLEYLVKYKYEPTLKDAFNNTFADIFDKTGREGLKGLEKKYGLKIDWEVK